MNISSVIVNAQPGRVAAVRTGLDNTPGVEIHAGTDDGKFIVTIETGSDAETVGLFERINLLDGVMSTAMVYHQFESDPENEVSVQANPRVAPELHGGSK